MQSIYGLRLPQLRRKNSIFKLTLAICNSNPSNVCIDIFGFARKISKIVCILSTVVSDTLPSRFDSNALPERNTWLTELPILFIIIIIIIVVLLYNYWTVISSSDKMQKQYESPSTSSVSAERSSCWCHALTPSSPPELP